MPLERVVERLSLSALQADGEDKPTAHSRRIGFDPDPAFMKFYNLFAHGQSNASAAAISVSAMKALEDLEDPLVLFGRNADAVIINGNLPSLRDATHMQVDLRGPRWVRIFDGIPDQILENTGHLTWVTGD